MSPLLAALSALATLFLIALLLAVLTATSAFLSLLMLAAFVTLLMLTGFLTLLLLFVVAHGKSPFQATRNKHDRTEQVPALCVLPHSSLANDQIALRLARRSLIWVRSATSTDGPAG